MVSFCINVYVCMRVLLWKTNRKLAYLAFLQSFHLIYTNKFAPGQTTALAWPQTMGEPTKRAASPIKVMKLFRRL